MSETLLKISILVFFRRSLKIIILTISLYLALLFHCFIIFWTIKHDYNKIFFS